MSASKDLNWANLSTVQGSENLKPNTIAAAATIAPTSFITLVTGTTAVETITPPALGQHMLILIFTDGTPGTMVTTGNILNAVVPTSVLPTFMFYDPNQAKYYGGTLNLT